VVVVVVVSVKGKLICGSGDDYDRKRQEDKGVLIISFLENPPLLLLLLLLLLPLPPPPLPP